MVDFEIIYEVNLHYNKKNPRKGIISARVANTEDEPSFMRYFPDKHSIDLDSMKEALEAKKKNFIKKEQSEAHITFYNLRYL